jgi:hypothetical protein
MPRDDEVPMEVDQPTAAEQTTPKKSIPPLTVPRVSIPETTVQALGAFLGAVLELPPTLDPVLVLVTIWTAVHEALLQDETMKTHLADKA